MVDEAVECPACRTGSLTTVFRNAEADRGRLRRISPGARRISRGARRETATISERNVLDEPDPDPERGRTVYWSAPEVGC